MTILFDKGSSAAQGPAAAAPTATSSFGLVPYTFDEGSLGITLAEARGGTRVAIGSVAPHSQAETLRVPTGGMVMSINGRSATGLRVPAVGKWLAQASRPLTLIVMHPDCKPSGVGGAEAASASSASKENHHQMPAGAGPRNSSPGAPTPYVFPAGPLGLLLKDVEGSEEGGGGGVAIKDVAPGGAAEARRVPVDGALTHVNETDVTGMSKAQVGKLLSKAERPLTLTICAPPPPPPMVVPFPFGDGPLGLTLIESAGQVVVKDVQSGGAASELGVIPGGMLMRLNGIELEGMSKAAIGKLFGKVSRPMTLHIEVEGDSPPALAHKRKVAAEAAATTAAAAAATATVGKAPSGKGGKAAMGRKPVGGASRKAEAKAAAAAAAAERERLAAEAEARAEEERLVAEAREEAAEAAREAAAAAAEKMARLTRAKKPKSPAASSRSADSSARRKRKARKAKAKAEAEARLGALQQRQAAGEELSAEERDELQRLDAKARAAKSKTKSKQSFELLRHGFEIEGPIAAGAFSTVLRARVLDSVDRTTSRLAAHVAVGANVAVKSFDNAKCRKFAWMAHARNAELGVLVMLKDKMAELQHPHIANMAALLMGKFWVHAILEYCGGGSLEYHLSKLHRSAAAFRSHRRIGALRSPPFHVRARACVSAGH